MSLLRTLSLLHHASHQAFPVGRNGSVLKRLKFVLRSWPHRRSNLIWFDLLQHDAFMRRLADHDHRIYRKLYRPYLSSTWTKDRTLAALQANYTCWREKLPPATVAAIFLTDAFCLAEWHANRTYQLRMTHDPRFYQEGEITISLWCPELGEGELALLSATLAPAADGTMTLHIGGLQGAARTLGLAGLKEAGRDLHGLRPKCLLVIAAQAVAKHLGCLRILATSSAGHAYTADRRRQTSERRKMFFDYDSFWEECDGVREGAAFYALPLSTVRRPREAMKPQKRPMYHRRYAMLDELEVAVTQALAPAVE
ncbi:MAG: DUF535 family protein [Verrucomicrobia bacterium]|nr:DUF535 family protein [Verrucomicrobiota bacterium]